MTRRRSAAHLGDACAAMAGVWPARGIAANADTTNAAASTPTEAIARWGMELLLLNCFLNKVTIYERLENSVSKNVLQRKLHDSRILGGDHLSKSIAIQNSVGILLAEGVGQIERFRSKFELSCFS